MYSLQERLQVAVKQRTDLVAYNCSMEEDPTTFLRKALKIMDEVNEMLEANDLGNEEAEIEETFDVMVACITKLVCQHKLSLKEIFVWSKRIFDKNQERRYHERK